MLYFYSMYSVDVMFLLSFFVSSTRFLFNDCCISWLNSLTDSYMIRQNSEYDQELPQSLTEDTPIANSYTYEVYGLSRDTFVGNTKYSGLNI